MIALLGRICGAALCWLLLASLFVIHMGLPLAADTPPPVPKTTASREGNAEGPLPAAGLPEAPSPATPTSIAPPAIPTAAPSARAGQAASTTTPTATAAVGRPIAAVVTMAPQPPTRTATRPSIQVPILMYHYIRVNPDPTDRLGYNLSVPPADLADQLDYLAVRGYHAIGLEEVAGYLAGERDAPSAQSVVLTFDDGYRDAYDAAFPLLKRHGFRATVFMISGLIDRPGYLTWAQLCEMAAGGVTIGAHTITHPDLRKATRTQAVVEIGESKAVLEKGLGSPVLFFSYPSGQYDDEVVGMVKAAGYRAAVTVNHGLYHAPEDRYTLDRVRVMGGAGVSVLAAAASLASTALTPIRK